MRHGRSEGLVNLSQTQGDGRRALKIKSDGTPDIVLAQAQETAARNHSRRRPAFVMLLHLFGQQSRNFWDLAQVRPGAIRICPNIVFSRADFFPRHSPRTVQSISYSPASRRRAMICKRSITQFARASRSNPEHRPQQRAKARDPRLAHHRQSKEAARTKIEDTSTLHARSLSPSG